MQSVTAIVTDAPSAGREHDPPAAAAGRPAAPPRRSGFRPDIQGLRAVAVLLVLLCHAGVPGLAGGYVGVDVFFVISGFLITGWLLERSLAPGRVPFARFYATRARRILPAAAVTLVAICATAWYALNSVRALAAVHDAIWAAVFAANVHFAAVGTDYFARTAPPSPVQHFWTLAVEEQFYLGWPVLLAAALILVGARRPVAERRVRRRLAFVVGAAVIALAAWSVHATEADPVAAYFSTLARAWELGLGVLIAVAVPFLGTIRPAARAVLTWAGLLGILASALWYDAATPFPGTAALLPVLSTGMVIVGGVGGDPPYGAGAVLRTPPMQLTGDISYSLYLWHWPVLVLAAGYAGHAPSVWDNLALLTVAFALAYLSFRLYEDPLRHARALAPPRRALLLWPVSLSAVAAAAIVAGSSLEHHRSAPPDLAVGPSAPSQPLLQRRAAGPPSTSVTLRVALAASLTPARLRSPIPDALAPSVDGLAHDFFDMHGCIAGRGGTGPVCRWGDRQAGRRLVVLGDSHAQMWMPAFTRLARWDHWQLVPLVRDGCVPSTMRREPCASWYAWAMGRLTQLHADAVIVSQFWSNWGPSGAAAIGRELRDLRRMSPRVVLMEDAPGRDEAATDCLLARGAILGSCTFPINSRQAATYADVRAEAASAGVTYVPTLQWLCVRRRCPTVVGNVIVFKDQHHITLTYARLLSGPLSTELARALR